MRNKGQIWMLLVLVALMPLAARADQKEDLKKKGDAAAAAGKPFESRDAYCQLAELDASYPQAKMMCSMMTKEAAKEDTRCDDRFSNATADVNASKFDDAEQKLKNVKPGCKKFDEARALMAKLPSLKQEAASKAGDAVMAQKYEQGLQSYNRNDFQSAKATLGQVTGSKASDAQALLNKIKQYEQAFSQGEQLAGAKNYKGALQAYNEAISFKGDGPGDPRGKARAAQDAMGEADKAATLAKQEADCRAKKPTLAAFQLSASNGQVGAPLRVVANAAPGCKQITSTLVRWDDGSQTTSSTDPKSVSGSHSYKNPGTYNVVAVTTDEAGNTFSQTQQVRIIELAVKQVVPEVDVEKTLAEARAAKAKKDIGLARGKYMKVLSADKSNKEAIQALDELSKMAATTPTPAQPEPQTPGVISEADALLGKGITEFYTAQFDDAMIDLRNYLQFKGEKVGLANFYIGALKATQYHLSGANDPKLQEAAMGAFKAAKKSPKFKVPEKYVSPKIVEMYNSAGM
ncbi:MAG TPA: PKD domain-containing protein [Terriglobales bacterium]|nr:PKD domain-containing protein [Terriglobales bacterium]